MKRLKIAAIIGESLLKAGGYEVFTYNLLSRLAGRGHRVVLYVTDREARRNGRFYDRAAFEYRSMPWNCMSLFKRFPALLNLWFGWQQRRESFDVWQVMGAYPEAAMVSCLSGRVPMVLRTHGDDVQVVPEIGYGLRLDPFYDRAVRAALKDMDRVVSLTEGVAPELEELGVERERIEVIPNGISCDVCSRNRDTAADRKRYGVGTDEFLLVTVGRNHPKKGFDLIPAVARGLKEMGLAFRWLVVGKDCSALEPELERQGVSGMVTTLPGIVPDDFAEAMESGHLPPEELVRIYAMADLFFFPSRIETFGRVLIESMASGTPVVATDCLGCRDVIEMGRYGAVVETDNVDMMIETVADLMRDRRKLAEYRELGLERAAHFDWSNVVDRYLAVYRELIND